jgi:uncharacterized 2Fe-2S/4Fe-4S cluster protein (DUF4445 family)
MDKYNFKINLDFEPISRRIQLIENKSLYELLAKSDIKITSLCGGKGTCGKCKIQVQTGGEYLNQPTAAERQLLDEIELKKGWRLACQVRVSNEYIPSLEAKKAPQFRIFLPAEILMEDFKILASGLEKEMQLNPNVKKVNIIVQKPTLQKPIPDFERVLMELSQIVDSDREITIELEVLKKFPKIFRNKEREITLTLLAEKKIIDIELGNTVENNFGIAFDIGTTTLVGYLMNLYDGKTYAISSLLNPQTAFGEDVITRITYIKDKEDGLEELNSSVKNAMNDIIEKTCEKAGITSALINEITMVGNSVMHHIALGIDPTYIGLSPYVPVIQRGINIKAQELGLKGSPNANVFALPLIAGFVGADTVGVILSSEIESQEDLTLAIDIGTNGEIIIGNKDIMATGSCAAGSALEGAHIKFGMRAAGGAIDTIKIDPNDLSVSYTTIKNKNPVGICGSGLIDAIAEMLRSRILNRSGNFNKKVVKGDHFLAQDNRYEFILARKEETSIGKDITITQQDIREIQMAKAAFYSGTEIILDYLNHSEQKVHKIKQIFLAGAFGNYIDKVNAKFIGMIPDIEDHKIFQIGNAAGMGAQMSLINKDYRIRAQQILKKIKYVEIAVHKEFQRKYAEAMYFPHLNLKKFSSHSEYSSMLLR